MMEAWHELPKLGLDYLIQWKEDGDYALDFRFQSDGNPEDLWDITGHLKWDGCMNWQTDDHCMAHFCEPSNARALTAAFMAVWELGAAYIPRWDKTLKLDLKP